MGYYSDAAIGDTIGEMDEARQLDRIDGVPTLTAQEIILRARCTAAGLDYDAEVAAVHKLDAAGLCRTCEAEPRQMGLLCIGCHAAQVRAAELERQQREHEQVRAAIAEYRAAALAAGIVVGARVTRKRGGRIGTVVEIGAGFVRVSWDPANSHHLPGFRTSGRPNRSRIGPLASLVVVQP